MKLRSQMLFAGALTLAVPLVGWQSVKQLYSALQQTRIDEQTLKVANMRLALSDSAQISNVLSSGLKSAGSNDWYAQTSPYPMFVDGYADDWQELREKAFKFPMEALESNSVPLKPDLNAAVRVAKREGHLWLFLTVEDDAVVYHTPPLLRADAGEGELPDQETRLVNGDSVEILMQMPNGEWQHSLFRPIAPGTLSGLRASSSANDSGFSQTFGQSVPGWEGAWVTESSGYYLELKLPLPDNGAAIGLAVVDVDSVGEARTSWVGSLSPDVMEEVASGNASPNFMAGGLIFHDSASSRKYLERWTSPGVRARLFDVNGRLQADVDNLYENYDNSDEATENAESGKGLWDAILRRLFAFFVAGDLPLLPETRNTPVTLKLSDERRLSVIADEPITSRYVTDENDRVLGTLAPIGSEPRRGYLLYEANEEHASAYAGSEMARLFSLLLLVSLLAGTGLLVFAFVLSSRIRRLSRQAQQAISADGRVQGLPGSDAQDEIGDLSRKLSSLLSRSAAYTQYLEALASRLSHELRTPLSVVRTSLENIDRGVLDEQSQQLIDRASGGADHLSSIIKALVESTRLEQSVQLADRQSINLNDWLAGSLVRYEQVYPLATFSLGSLPNAPVIVTASPELLQQAYDKMVDNAVSFAAEMPIVLSLTVEDSTPVPSVALSVGNKGEAVSDSDTAHWFDPMYSERSAGSSDLHLGLGLYVVKMIAEAHGGGVFTRNHLTSNGQNWIQVGMSLVTD